MENDARCQRCIDSRKSCFIDGVKVTGSRSKRAKSEQKEVKEEKRDKVGGESFYFILFLESFANCL